MKIGDRIQVEDQIITIENLHIDEFPQWIIYNINKSGNIIEGFWGPCRIDQCQKPTKETPVTLHYFNVDKRYYVRKHYNSMESEFVVTDIHVLK